MFCPRLVGLSLSRLSLARLALLAPLALATGCFYDSSWGARKTAQIHNAARAAPASLAPPSEASGSGGASAEGTTVLHVRVHATTAYAAQTPNWKSHVASLVAQASTTLQASVGVQLAIDSADPWDHLGAAKLDADLFALREEDTGEGTDLVMGFVGGLPLTTQSFDQLGMSELPGKHVVLRAPNIAGEYAAIEKAFDELSAEARTRLRRERIRHREVAVMLHEVGHALGADHADPQAGEASLMRPAYDAKMSAYDPAALTHMKERLAHLHEPATLTKGAAPAASASRDPAKSRPPEPAVSVASGSGPVVATAPTSASAPAATEEPPTELRAPDRELWRRALDVAKAGDAPGAWSTARPLFAAYPRVYVVQDLRCKLAMAASSSYDAARKECDPLMKLTMEGGRATGSSTK